MRRRRFLKNLGLQIGLQGLGFQGAFASDSWLSSLNSPNSIPQVLKPPRLQPGDTIGLVSPATSIHKSSLKFINLKLNQVGFRAKAAPHVLDEYGYLAGRDLDRAADINAMFADDSVKAILATTGGWGSNRILPLLDYNLIRQNPKIVLGFSDITGLLLGLYSQCQLISFHGLLGLARWSPPSMAYFQQVLIAGEKATFRNTAEIRVQTLTAGRAQGRLVGGNLSVLAGLVGSDYLPDWNNTILFVEDVGEDVYRVDRLITHLKLAGVLSKLSGFIFAKCTRCLDETDPSPTLTLWQMLEEQIRPLGIPAWYGSMMGHLQNQFIVPIGALVEIDAVQGTIQMLETAVI
ncbi:MAG: LD-carboxypeptidase [Microcoleaceae cyanobacterium]